MNEAEAVYNRVNPRCAGTLRAWQSAEVVAAHCLRY